MGYSWLASWLLIGQLLGPAPQVEPRPATPAQAVEMALADAASRPETERPFLRYIWLGAEADQTRAKLCSYALNSTLSRSDLPYTWGTEPGRRALMRINLFTLAGRDLPKVIELWDRMPNPYFQAVVNQNEILEVELLTQIEVLQESQLLSGASIVGTVPAGITLDFTSERDGFFGVTFAGKKGWLKAQHCRQLKKAVANRQVAQFAEHVGIEQATKLQLMVKANNPIVRWDHFLVTALNTLDRGLYYEFIDIPRGKGKQTDYDALLVSLGTSEAELQGLRKDQRTASLKSGITAKPRQIEFLGIGNRPEANSGFFFVTHDITDETRGAAKHPIRSLANFDDDGREVIWEWRNGSNRYALYDGNGKLVIEAPSAIAVDSEIPAPFTNRLRPPISCIRCHGTDGSKGFKPVENDVRDMLKAGLDVFGDGSLAGKPLPEVLMRLAELYAGDVSKPLMRARDDLEESTFVFTGGMTFKEMSTSLAQVFKDYHYTFVTPQQACYELGYVVDTKQAAVAKLWQLLPRLPDQGEGFNPEDPVIGSLKLGKSITRLDWEDVYADAANRAALQRLKEEKR